MRSFAFSLIIFIVATVSGLNNAQAFNFENVPLACLPDRASRDQQEACHCPPEKLCEDPEAMPYDMQVKCCDTAEGACKKNGCKTGWKLGSGVLTSGSFYYCKEEPDCSKLLDHIPNSIRSDITQDPRAVKKISGWEVFDNKTGRQETSDAWVCEVENYCSEGVPLFDSAAFWKIAGSLKNKTENVCFYPTICGRGDCGETTSLDNVSFARGCGKDCLPKNIKILMADGKEKSIQDITVGDEVKTQTSTNKVLEVAISKADEKPMFSINDGAFIITAGHPMLTQKGWSALGVSTTAENRETRNWSGRALRIGDMLIGEKGAVKVVKITEVKAEDGESYNLKLSGDNSFIANGVVVQGFESNEIHYKR